MRIVLVSIGLAMSVFMHAQNSVVSNLQFREIKANIFNMDDVYEAITHMSVSTEGISEFMVNAGAGDMEINPSESDKIEVYAKVYVSEKSAEKAYALALRSLNLSLENTASRTKLESQFDEVRDRIRNGKYSIDLMIKVPKHIEIEIEDGAGDIEMRDLKNNFSCSDQSGDITLDNVAGIIKIDDGSGDISIYGHKATLNGENVGEIKDASGDIVIKNAIQSLSITDGAGDLEISNLTGSLNITDGPGDVEIRNVSQSINMVDNTGEINIEKVGLDINIIDGTGDINVDDVGGDLIVDRNSTGDIKTNNIRGKLKLPKD